MIHDPIVTVSWLQDHLDDPAIVVLDASYHLPGSQRNAEADFLQAHIPGARRFDLDDISDHASPLPHMLPSAEAFAQAMSALGISSTNRVIAYDTLGLFSAGRAWWMLRVFGHEKVSVLDGGLPAWKNAGYPLASGAISPYNRGNFSATLNKQLLRHRDEVFRAAYHREAQIIDARSATRFSGETAEPRPGLRSGHIPGAKNLPLQSILTSEGKLRSKSELEGIIQATGIDTTQPMIATCGSGVTACGVALGLTILGANDVAIYDGSWAEWGADTTLPFEIGPGSV